MFSKGDKVEYFNGGNTFFTKDWEGRTATVIESTSHGDTHVKWDHNGWTDWPTTANLRLIEEPAATGLVADLAKVFTDSGDLLLKKHQDYGSKNISRAPGGPLNGLRVRMHDKLARINNLIDSGAKPENESLRDSFTDLLNYSAIALLVLDGKWPAE